MIQYKLGYFARSLAGHDKGKLYMIVKEAADFVELCDGKNKTLKNPKRKKKIHIQMMKVKQTAESFDEKINGEDADAWIREQIEQINF